MDELDRLYRHLVDTLRTDAPHLLRQRFTVGDIGQQLIPYRLHRRALGIDTIQQYEQLVLRLVAGERGYLSTEAVVQDASRQALAAPTVDTDVLRRFVDAPAALAPEPLRLVLAELERAPAAARTESGAHPAASPTGGSPADLAIGTGGGLPRETPVRELPAREAGVRDLAMRDAGMGDPAMRDAGVRDAGMRGALSCRPPPPPPRANWTATPCGPPTSAAPCR